MTTVAHLSKNDNDDDLMMVMMRMMMRMMMSGNQDAHYEYIQE